jgi:F-type H+-transporting ATPase subunit delta
MVVKRYVTALILAGEESGALERIEADIKTLETILFEKEIRDYCFKENLSAGQENAFVSTAFIPYVGELTGRFLTVMAENRRMAAIPFAAAAFRELMEQRRGGVHLTLETAHDPDSETVEIIRERMSGRLGSDVEIVPKKNPSLLGGFRLQWGNRIIDMSVKGQLDKLRVFLKQE